MDWKERIESDPDKLFGKPVVKGTRVPVDLLLEKMGNGESMAELLAAYPHLTPADLDAVAELLAGEPQWTKSLADEALTEHRQGEPLP
jgi:uncharacterized protein (DUF433 family)